MQLKVKKLHPDAVLPTYAHEGDACVDIHVLHEGSKPHPTDRKAQIFRTGLAFEIPPGWALMIYSRSGGGFKDGVRLSNCVGVIDASYRGEVMVSLRSDSGVVPEDGIGRKPAQAMLVQVPQIELIEVEELSQTERGAGGFGSTGA